ncbi:MAG: hypothetical protein HY077_06525 [Elusimicrobia bacterium]|nr:hypothetical protein [Elusimicrobiota bacterium]
MKRNILAIGLSVLAAAAAAQEPAPAAKKERAWRYFFAYDYFLPDDGGKGLRGQLRTKSAASLALGYTNTDFSVHTQGAVGARFGAFHPMPHRTELGLSLGYLLGPNMTANYTATGGPGPGGITINRDVVWIRELVQGHVYFPATQRVTLVAGVGVGVATGRVTEGCDRSGTLACSFGTQHHTWTGFTYEVSANIRYRAGKLMDLRFGPRFAGFPTYNGNDVSARIDYAAFGFFAGAIF